MQLICQYFTRQLVWISPFVNILPLQNIPMHGIFIITAVKKERLTFMNINTYLHAAHA